LESYFRILTSVIEFQDLQEIILEIIFWSQKTGLFCFDLSWWDEGSLLKTETSTVNTRILKSGLK